MAFIKFTSQWHESPARKRKEREEAEKKQAKESKDKEN